MRKTKQISPWLMGAISLTSVFTLAACGAQVIGGGSGGTGGSGNGGAGGNGNGGSGSAGGSTGSANAMAMLYSELQSPDPAGGTTVASSGGGGPDPNTLYIALSNTPEICTEPFAAEPCGNNYRVSFGIPVALQKVGIIALNDPSLIASFSWSGDPDGPDTCPFGGGSFIDGELEITEIDSTHVAGILTNTPTSEFDVNGPFDAPRCTF